MANEIFDLTNVDSKEFAEQIQRCLIKNYKEKIEFFEDILTIKLSGSKVGARAALATNEEDQ